MKSELKVGDVVRFTAGAHRDLADATPTRSAMRVVGFCGVTSHHYPILEALDGTNIFAQHRTQSPHCSWVEKDEFMTAAREAACSK